MGSKNHSCLENHNKFMRYLVDKDEDGPEGIDYHALNSWVLKITEQVKDERLIKKEAYQNTVLTNRDIA